MPTKRESVFVLRSAAEIDGIREAWSRMQCHPNADIDFFLKTIETYRNVLRPHVILMLKGEEPELILACRLEESKFESRIGYKVVSQSTVKTLILIYGGLMGNAVEENCTLLVRELMNTLERGEADLVFVNHIRTDSPFFVACAEIPRGICRDRVPIPNAHWRMTLPSSYEEFFRTRSRNFRNNLRKYHRLWESIGREDLKVRYYKDGNDLDRLIRDSELVSSKTYHRGMGAGFVDSIETREMMRFAAGRNMLRGYVMYLHGNPCAFLTGNIYKDVYYPGATGYDPKYRNLNPGIFIFLKMIEDLCQEKEVKYVDFGFGDADYKKNFCKESWTEAVIYIYPNTLKGGWLNLLRSISVLIDRTGKNVLARNNMIGKVKKAWRNRLVKQ